MDALQCRDAKRFSRENDDSLESEEETASTSLTVHHATDDCKCRGEVVCARLISLDLEHEEPR